MSGARYTFNSGGNNRVTITGSGGTDNTSFTLEYGGYDDSYRYTSNMKTGSYTGTVNQDVKLGNFSYIQTNDSSRVEGIRETMANVRVDFVGDRHYQDSEAAHAFLNTMSGHMAQRASTGTNEGGFDIGKLLSRLKPIDFGAIADRLSSVTATPNNLKPMPSADTIWNLPTAVATATENQIEIDRATMSKVLTLVPLSQTDACAAQNELTMRRYEEAGEEGILSTLASILPASLTGYLTPVAEPEDSYAIDDNAAFAGLEDWINRGIPLENMS